MKTEFIDASEVAQMTGIASRAVFLLKRRTLERDHDMPPPLPWLCRPLKWRRSTVEAWFAQQGQQTDPVRTPLPTGTNVVLLEKASVA